MKTIEIEPNKTFAWPKGSRLIPCEKVTIVFPEALIQKDEEIGAVIQVSDNAEIGFQNAQNSGELFGCIILIVAEGDGIRINRATQAILTSDTRHPIAFQVEG